MQNIELENIYLENIGLVEIVAGSRVWRDSCFPAPSMAAAVWECHVTYSDKIPRGETLNMIRWSPCAMHQNQICTHVSWLPTSLC